MPASRALLIASAVGTVLQLCMIWFGHTNEAIKNLFAVGGMGLSLLAGALYVQLCAPAARARSVRGAAIAGGICAFIGIAGSYALNDVPASLLALGTVSSIVTGAIGGLAARKLLPSG
jgi:hypothetical protein